jgi:hypothetical protein
LKRIYALQDEYIKTIDPVIAFARQNPTLALQICQEDYLPEASICTIRRTRLGFWYDGNAIKANIWLLYTLRIFQILL